MLMGGLIDVLVLPTVGRPMKHEQVRNPSPKNFSRKRGSGTVAMKERKKRKKTKE